MLSDLKYTLDANGEPVICTDLITWAMWIEHERDKWCIRTDLGKWGSVSTIFLGIDYGWSFLAPDPLTYRPTLWETMVFGGEHDCYQRRYTSRKEALEGHRETVEMVRERTTLEKLRQHFFPTKEAR
jgi:hypothetical protein